MDSPVPDAEAAPVQGEAGSPTRKRGRRTILIGVLAVLLVGGGVAAAGGYFGWYGGGGTHPYDVMPASTLAYVQLDLNPSLEQKTQAWGFLRDLPEVQEATFGQPDPNRILWSLTDRLWVGRTWTDYDTDLKPWLGDRIGVGILGDPADPNKEAIWVTAIQVTDAAKAVVKLQEWLDATKDSYEVTTRDRYAIITAKQTASFVHAEQAKGLLGHNQRFTADLRSVGENGWMAGWLDLGALAASSPSPTDNPGRTAFALRFSGDTLEFSGKVLGWKHAMVNGAGQLGTLPASTGVGISVSDGAAAMDLPLPWLGSADVWRLHDGLQAPDVAALEGRNLTISTPSTNIMELYPGPKDRGFRVVTDDAARAQQALHTVAGDVFANQLLAFDQVDGNVLTAATSKAYLAELTGSPEKLSGSATFTAAVPDHARAAAAFYLNLQAFLAGWADSDSPYSHFAGSMRALGGQYFDEGSGNGSWSVRLVRA